jgi:hypothetical protein
MLSGTPAGPMGGRLLLGVAVVMTALAAPLIWSLLRFEPIGMDFLPLWTAGKLAWTTPGKVYDFAAVTAGQAWLLPPHFAWLRPYAYPPTTLLLLAPLGRLPYWVALGVWSALSMGVFFLGAVRLAGRNVALAALLTAALPAVVIAVTAGQTVVLTSGLIVLAVLELPRRPRLAGALLAIAAIVKPQAVLMAPIGLVACGAFEALVSAGIVGAAAVAASAVLFGPARWHEWLASLPGFQHVIESVPALATAVITPLWAARELGLQGLPAVLIAAAFALGGAWLTWRTFRRPVDPARRVAALAVGSLIAAPYAMCYDAALIAPAATAIAIAGLQRGRIVLPLLALGAAFEVTAPNLGLPALLAFAALVMVEWRPGVAVRAAAGGPEIAA